MPWLLTLEEAINARRNRKTVRMRQVSVTDVRHKKSVYREGMGGGRNSV